MKKYILFLLIITAISCKKREQQYCSSSIVDFLPYCRTEKGPSFNYSDSMSVGEFWQQQECVIKRSYQDYNIVLNINNVKIPVSLIGCGCPNEIVDIYQMYTFIVNVHNDSIFINGQPETLSGLSGYTYSIYSKHRHSEARDYFFLIKPESTQDMQFAAKVIAAIYTAYIIHMHYDELYENCINLMSPEEIKHMKRNNKAMLMLKPSDYESGYCENCNCAEINNKLAL